MDHIDNLSFQIVEKTIIERTETQFENGYGMIIIRNISLFKNHYEYEFKILKNGYIMSKQFPIPKLLFEGLSREQINDIMSKLKDLPSIKGEIHKCDEDY